MMIPKRFFIPLDIDVENKYLHWLFGNFFETLRASHMTKMTHTETGVWLVCTHGSLKNVGPTGKTNKTLVVRKSLEQTVKYLRLVTYIVTIP